MFWIFNKSVIVYKDTVQTSYIWDLQYIDPLIRAWSVPYSVLISRNDLILMDWDRVLGINQMSVWMPHSAFWDWQVNFGLPTLKYFYSLHLKFGVSKSGLIMDSCMGKSWCILQSYIVFLSNWQGQKNVLQTVFCIWMISFGKNI